MGTGFFGGNAPLLILQVFVGIKVFLGFDLTYIAFVRSFDFEVFRFRLVLYSMRTFSINEGSSFTSLKASKVFF